MMFSLAHIITLNEECLRYTLVETAIQHAARRTEGECFIMLQWIPCRPVALTFLSVDMTLSRQMAVQIAQQLMDF